MSEAEVIRATDVRLAALHKRLAELQGKETKRERQSINKEIYKLETADDYSAAVRERLQQSRAVEAAAHAQAEADRESEAASALSSAPRQPSTDVDSRHFRQQVEALFDEYAPDFEDALCNGLQYRTPQVLLEALLARPGRLEQDVTGGVLSRLDCIDFGCGTGLMGVAMRSACKGRILGCDLSRGMLRVAASTHPGVYDQLSAVDAVSFLRKLPPGSSDLIVGADVCVYMRSLDDLVAAAEAALCVGGVLAFSTELCLLEEVVGGAPPHGLGYVERASERIAHCAEYIAWLCSETAESASSVLELRSLESLDIRNDGDAAIRGHLAMIVKVRELSRRAAPDSSS